ncbi:hypothetical protein PIB30_032507 [Stylosanthes scabra]|uniref:Uncharacterized protein n=1 Tax=Stylosanthes scabra TaxID=79078 RepID=A0ABU6WDE0_9FABA|nr:hypothetical protein [Stylosanthes scabra]
MEKAKGIATPKWTRKQFCVARSSSIEAKFRSPTDLTAEIMSGQSQQEELKVPTVWPVVYYDNLRSSALS